MSAIHDRLRYHVTGAIERGEASAIAGIPAVESFYVMRECDGDECCLAHRDTEAAAHTGPMRPAGRIGE